MDTRVHPSLAALVAAVDGLVTAIQDPGSGLDGQVALDGLLAACAQAGRLQVAVAQLSSRVDADGLWAVDGSRSFAHWLAARTGMSYVRARDLAATGRELRDHLPLTAEAALAGDVSAEQAATMAKLATNTDARRQALAAPAEECGEGFLVEQARQDGADGFRRLVRRWAAAADPEADERGYRDACEREFLALSPIPGGYHLAGFLTVEHGAAVNAALDAVMAPPAPTDRRSTPQRRAQALADLARVALDHGAVGTGAAVRPHISVVVDFDTLRRAVEGTDDHRRFGRNATEGTGTAQVGDAARMDEVTQIDNIARVDDPFAAVGEGAGTAPDRSAVGAAAGCRFRLAPIADVERFAVGQILGAGPIPMSVLARLACDSEISRIVFGPDSQVINAGRAERTYAGPRRKAIVARDGTCRYPGCTAPPALGEIHHVDQWARDHGDTDVNTGLLLCWYHHDLVHRLAIRITRSPTGGWIFTTRHGQPITAAA